VGNQPEVAAEFTQIHPAEPVTEHRCGALAGMTLGRGHGQHGGLAGAVAPQHDPVLAILDPPVHVAQERTARNPDRNARQLDGCPRAVGTDETFRHEGAPELLYVFAMAD
jgi:hypothetical protein